ncbi:uncharacterized protein Pyn_15963 [Prunus yedoensis var. nudiflora]|uniref:(S)-ureidoglycine aminohydrolase cupin domain-containing protein n=1 Tax=Prunus yedoensis var. nudiflora TaxID=2094558 RepID=A0A314V2P6_PRUYE|nr:uncharacterized protein Pyn_15963 [Prunus yedoensis var. nudiflora]
MAAAAETTSNSADSFPNLRIIVESNPSDSRLSELDINSWPKWGCPPGKYTLKFDAAETCYLVKGKVKGTLSPSPKALVALGTSPLPLISTTNSTLHEQRR